MTAASPATPALEYQPALSTDDLETLDVLLSKLQTTHSDTPDWEMCDGFLTAIACTRRRIADVEWLPVLMNVDAPFAGGLSDPPSHPGPVLQVPFESLEQQNQFLSLCQRRIDEVRRQLETEVDDLDDPLAFYPEVLDLRGAIAAMSPEDQADIVDAGDEIPSFAQLWALGFMHVVQIWSDEWQPPRNHEVTQWLQDSLDAISALLENDSHPPAHCLFDEDAAPTISQKRLDLFAEAIWAVYDLSQIWRSLGPRLPSVNAGKKMGRNDPCHCGSGQKFKKCCGA